MEDEKKEVEVNEVETKETEVAVEGALDTKGFDLNKVIEDAKANGNEAFAELAEKQLAEYKRAKANIQTIYDLIGQKWTSTGENAWNIDAEYAKDLLK